MLDTNYDNKFINFPKKIFVETVEIWVKKLLISVNLVFSNNFE